MFQKLNVENKKNKEYFTGVAHTVGSITSLPLYLAILAMSGLLLFVHWMIELDFHQHPPFTVPGMILLSSVMSTSLLILTIVCNPVKNWLYRHQVFAGVWQVLFSLQMTLVMALMAFAFVVRQDGQRMFHTNSSLKVGLLFLLVYILSHVYHFYWVHHQVQHGFSKRHTKNLILGSFKAKSIGAIGLIVSGSLTGRYLTGQRGNLFGIIACLLFLLAFPRITAVFTYMTAFKKQDRRYWEEDDGTPVIAPEVGKRLVRIGGEIALFFGTVYVGMNILPESHPLVPLTQWIVRGLVLYWIIRFVLRKWKKRGINQIREDVDIKKD